MTGRKFKEKGDLSTQVTAALPKPYYDLLRVIIYETNASTAEVVRFLVCSQLRELCPNLPEYEFEPGPNPPGLKPRH